MVSEIADRIDEWLPSDVDEWNEIQMAIAESGWSDKWAGTVQREVAQSVNEMRDFDKADWEREVSGQTVLAGPAGGGGENRFAMIQDENGDFLGKEEDTNTWEDQHGHVWGQREGAPNDTRRIISRAEDRDT